MIKNDEIKLNLDTKITEDTVLFFDLDGTLINTDLANFLSYEDAVHTVMQCETKMSFDPNERFNRITLKKLIPNLSKVEYEKIIVNKERNYKDYLTHTDLNNLVVDILIQYNRTNKTVLVTNCRKDRALMTLNYHNLVDKFGSLFFRENYSNENNVNKFQNAITSLNISPDTVLVFENEQREIEDAILAGVLEKNVVKI